MAAEKTKGILQRERNSCEWSPLGANGATWGSYAVMESPILKEIAAAKGKSVAQVSFNSFPLYISSTMFSCLLLRKVLENFEKQKIHYIFIL